MAKPLSITEEEFDREVLMSDLPVVVDFYADWCAPCRMLEPIMEMLAKKFEGTVKFVRIDVDTNQELASQYSVISIPTVMFFSKGQVMDVVIGVAPANIYLARIEKLLA